MAAAHRFAIGQSVWLKNRFGMSPRTAETYRITGTLPARDNSPQYRIRNDDERHERVATEDSLIQAAGAYHGQRSTAQQSGAPKAEERESAREAGHDFRIAAQAG